MLSAIEVKKLQAEKDYYKMFAEAMDQGYQVLYQWIQDNTCVNPEQIMREWEESQEKE